jgi:hypothetical protein
VTSAALPTEPLEGSEEIVLSSGVKKVEIYPLRSYQNRIADLLDASCINKGIGAVRGILCSFV